MIKVPRVRIRTATERKKALSQLTELRSQGKVGQALVIILRTDGDIEVLAQEMRAYEVPRLLYAATMALEHAEQGRVTFTREPLEMPLGWGEIANPGDRIRPKITTNADGIQVPPPGESIISCAVCHHPRYFVCVGDTGTPSDGLPIRLACGHCGNEVSFSRDDWQG
jgi:hypothetical protein